MSESKKENSIQSALEESLRLHPQRVDIGQAEMLTDALLHHFDDLEQRLNTYITGSAGGDKLRKSMQAYLSRLNSNTMIPLHFRLRVLNRFEEKLDLFDAEMTAAILNAHKIGIDMVQKEAQKEPAYYPILVGMISQAIELAGQLVRDILADYQVPAIITIRQVFDLIRLGMVILPELPEGAEKEKKRLHLAIVRYELMRKLDFYSKMKSEKNMLMDELEHHIGLLVPYYLPKGGLMDEGIKGYSLLVSNLSRPNDTAQMLPFPPQTTATDYLIVPMDDFLDKLVMAIDRAEKVLKNPILQSKDLQIEKDLKTTIIGGNAILDALRTKSRSSERQEYGNAKLFVSCSLESSIARVYDEMSVESGLSAPLAQEADEDSKVWTVMNVSKGGLAIERMGRDLPVCDVGSMVGLHWQPHRGEPQFGFVRWLRYPKPEEQQVGIKLHLEHYLPVRATMVPMGDTKKTRSWPVLATFEDDGEHTLVFPDTSVFKGMVFELDDEDYPGYFKVKNIESSGLNYAVCLVGIAAELR